MSTFVPPSSRDSDALADQDDIDAFLREEGVPVASSITRDDIAAALVTLGYTVATASVKFVVKVALRRLDTLACVAAELQTDSDEKEKSNNAAERRPSLSPLGWSRHLYAEDKSANTFLRGGWADFGFVLATSIEETAVVFGLRTVYGGLFKLWKGAPRSGLGVVCLNLLTHMLLAGLLSWPLRAVRTAVMVNYLADTTFPPAISTVVASETEVKTMGKPTAHRYTSASEVFDRVRQRVGLRSLLLNGLDVDMASRVLSLGLVWTLVHPSVQWIRRVAMLRARAAVPGQNSLPDTIAVVPSSSSLMERLGQHRYFDLAALLVMVGVVNTLQRPFVVVRQRMALMPAGEEEGVMERKKAEGVEKESMTSAARPGCRYASGWDCVRQVVRREGVTALFAGLPLCLLTSTVVPLVVTFAGFPTTPSFSGAAV